MNTATLVKTLTDYRGDARLYTVDPPMRYEAYDIDGDEQTLTTEHVIVSAVVVESTGPETYIFAADGEGEITEWSELDGSLRGVLDHAAALRAAGYEVTP